MVEQEVHHLNQQSVRSRTLFDGERLELPPHAPGSSRKVWLRRVLSSPVADRLPLPGVPRPPFAGAGAGGVRFARGSAVRFELGDGSAVDQRAREGRPVADRDVGDRQAIRMKGAAGLRRPHAASYASWVAGSRRPAVAARSARGRDERT